MIILESSALSRYLKKYESIYPGIEIWYQKRVEPDIFSGVKILYRFDKNLEIEGLGIVDLVQSKLCHLSIEHAIRGSGLGMAILKLAHRDLLSIGNEYMWCHGPENMVGRFCEWSTGKPVKTLHSFGRNSGIKDVLLNIKLK